MVLINTLMGEERSNKRDIYGEEEGAKYGALRHCRVAKFDVL